MSILGSNMLAGAAGRAKHEIERSLRFNSGDSAYLNRTPGSAGNRRTFTFSCWCKRSKLGIDATLFSAATNTDNFFKFSFKDDNRFEINTYENGDSTQMFTTAVFRDVSSWYHIVVAFDTTQSTAANRVKLYVNGTQVTAFDNNTLPSQNHETVANSTGEHQVGNQINNTRYFDGYIAEVNQVDGLQLGPESFGQTELETGAWIPRQYNGSYGTNGFYLKFADNSGVTATTLGKDSSGNSNNFTPNNFSVTAGADNDSLLDRPTNNWCTLNSVLGDSLNITSNGNLRVGGTQNNYAVGTIAFPSFGKYYAEATLTTYSSGQVQFGICPTGAQSNLGNDATAILQDGSTTVNNASSTSLASYTQGDVIGIAVDVDNSTVQFYKNNTAQTALTNVLRITEASFFTYLSISSTVINYNFGQHGFKYTPPAGFQALNARNLPTPTVLDGTKNFNTVLYTGNSSTQSVTGVGFQPDWTWIKGRGSATYNNHILTDVVRGVGKVLQSNQFVAEAEAATSLTSFDSDGFSLGAFEDVNTNNNTYVAWNWKAGGTASNNYDGSTISLVSVNPEAGFSIVSFSAPSGSNQETIGHGLNAKPKVIISKNRDTNANNWAVFHEEATDTTSKFLRLNTTDSIVTYSTVWGSALPTSTVFGATGGGIAASGTANIAYCFAEVEGYSKFGSYTGNGSDNGPFVYTGFKPAFVLVKSATNGNGWYLADTARSPFNVSQATLSPHSADTEDTTAGGAIDILSNGFKSRNSAGQFNDSGQTYAYIAFAEMPFKYANAR